MSKVPQLILLLILFLISCKKDTTPIPSYVIINSFVLNTTQTNGSNTTNISDAWLYINNELQDIKEIPCTIPVFQNGNISLKVNAGIKVSGQSSIRKKYPFYTAHNEYITLIENDYKKIDPNIEYEKFSQFISIIDFENNTSVFDASKNSNLNINPSTEKANTGLYSGKAELTNTNTYLLCETSNSFKWEGNENEYYLEIDYLNDILFNIGISYTINNVNSQTTILNGIFAKDFWNKVYIDLKSTLNSLPNGTDFKIFIESNNLDKLQSANLYFDNIKLIKY